MIILFSPTKQMDFESPLSPVLESLGSGSRRAPLFADRAEQINSLLESMNGEELQKLMKISPTLAEQTEKMISSFSSAPRRAALTAYSGTSFKSLDVSTLDAVALSFAQDNLCILSGMYGILRPMDLIAPYRMEMKASLSVGDASSLTAFWKPLVSRLLEGEDFVLNLASAEYARVVSLPKGRMVDLQFKEEDQNGKLRTVGMYAKQARGLMLRQILMQQVENGDQIQLLSPGGYVYRKELSSDKCWVFVRNAAL